MCEMGLFSNPQWLLINTIFCQLVVLQSEAWHDELVSAAIYQGWADSCSRIRLFGKVRQSQVHKRLNADHILGHVVCPLEDLWAHVDEEGVRRLSTEYHDLGRRVVIDCHCSGY
jgi:hypothetical protein